MDALEILNSADLAMILTIVGYICAAHLVLGIIMAVLYFFNIIRLRAMKEMAFSSILPIIGIITISIIRLQL